MPDTTVPVQWFEITETTNPVNTSTAITIEGNPESGYYYYVDSANILRWARSEEVEPEVFDEELERDDW